MRIYDRLGVVVNFFIIRSINIITQVSYNVIKAVQHKNIISNK